MELKYFIRVMYFVVECCSNRTFMELKFIKPHKTTGTHQVLIVPLWN